MAPSSKLGAAGAGFGDVPFYGDIKNNPLSAGQRSIDRWFNTDAASKSHRRSN
jgi:hypothetical protein